MTADRPFWRAEPLTQAEQELMRVVLVAHHESSFRDNLSSQAVQMAAIGSGDLLKAVSAGLMMLGGLHAPLLQTIELLRTPHAWTEALNIALAGGRVPGWGNSFVKGKPDPIWQPVDDALQKIAPELWVTIEHITAALHGASIDIYPNPGCYTAATAITLRMPSALAPYLFVLGRLQAWSQLFSETLTKTPKIG